MVTNVHQRTLNAPVRQLAPLIDQLASSQDVFWPLERWPALQSDRPLGVGAVGGHDDIGYVVESYLPGRDIVFRFTAPKGFDGMHPLMLEELPDGKARIKHTLTATLEGPMILLWPVIIRFMHDALIEDGLDRAEAWAERCVLKLRPWNPWVQILHWLEQAVGKAQPARG